MKIRIDNLRTATRKNTKYSIDLIKEIKEKLKNKLANEGALNPTKPSTDGIKGQSMAGMVQEMNSEDNMNNSGTIQPQQPNTENNQMPTADNQAQQPTKKKSWWKFW